MTTIVCCEVKVNSATELPFPFEIKPIGMHRDPVEAVAISIIIKIFNVKRPIILEVDDILYCFLYYIRSLCYFINDCHALTWPTAFG